MLGVRLPTTLVALLVLSACGDPLRDVPRLTDVPVAADPAAAVSSDGEGEVLPNLVEEASEGTAPRRGLLSVLFPGRSAQREPEPEAEAASFPTPEPEVQGGLLRDLFPAQPAAAEGEETGVAPGTLLPFGEVARICNAPRNLGQEIARYPERRPVYRVFDTAPNLTGPRVHYVTGFGDRCARMFTASLVTLGDAESHEFFRYTVAGRRAYSETDEAYERIKRRVCGASRGQPCGGAIERLQRDTVFVSVYPTFGGGRAPAVLLLHGGELAASSAP